MSETSIAPTSTVARTVSRSFDFTPVDRVILVYLLYVPTLGILFGLPGAQFFGIVVGNSLVAAGVLLITRFLPYDRNRGFDFIRGAYPALLFGYFYNQTGKLMTLLFPDFFDPVFVEWERSLLGANVTVWLDLRLLGEPFAVWVTELLSMTYFSYYLMFPAVVIGLFWVRREKLLNEVMTACAITFFVSYQLFWLFPLEGPRWHFASDYLRTLDGPFFRQMVDFVIANGAVHGGCMPSTHSGVALVILLYLYREYRKLYWIALPFVIGIALGAVYGRFHYPSDIVIGALIAAVCTKLTMKYYPRWTGESNHRTHST